MCFYKLHEATRVTRLAHKRFDEHIRCKFSFGIIPNTKTPLLKGNSPAIDIRYDLSHLKAQLVLTSSRLNVDSFRVLQHLLRIPAGTSIYTTARSYALKLGAFPDSTC